MCPGFVERYPKKVKHTRNICWKNAAANGSTEQSWKSTIFRHRSLSLERLCSYFKTDTTGCHKGNWLRRYLHCKQLIPGQLNHFLHGQARVLWEHDKFSSHWALLIPPVLIRICQLWHMSIQQPENTGKEWVPYYSSKSTLSFALPVKSLVETPSRACKRRAWCLTPTAGPWDDPPVPTWGKAQAAMVIQLLIFCALGIVFPRSSTKRWIPEGVHGHRSSCNDLILKMTNLYGSQSL